MSSVPRRPGPTGVPGGRRTVFCLGRPGRRHELRPDQERIENVDRGPFFPVGQRPRPSVGGNGTSTEGVEYDVDHAVDPANGDIWLVRSDRGPASRRSEDFALFELPVGANDPVYLRPLIPYRPAVKLESVDAFARHALRPRALRRPRTLEGATPGGRSRARRSSARTGLQTERRSRPRMGHRRGPLRVAFYMAMGATNTPSTPRFRKPA